MSPEQKRLMKVALKRVIEAYQPTEKELEVIVRQIFFEQLPLRTVVAGHEFEPFDGNNP